MNGPVLVLGASGLVGGEYARVARARGLDVVGAARSVLGEATIALDVTDERAIASVLERHSPSAVAVCAAYSHVDGCEADPARSERENVSSMRALSRALGSSRVPVVFYSSDQVFDGTRDAHVESDPPNPLNVYARHKLAAEEILLTRGHALVARTAWVFGEELRKKNFVYRVATAARTNERLLLPREQSGCPTWTRWLVDSTLDLLTSGARGVVHLTGGVPYTKASWARTIVSALGLEMPVIEEVDWVAAGQVAPRPARVVLASVRHGLRQPAADTILKTLRI